MTVVDPVAVDAAGGGVSDAQVAAIEQQVIASVLVDRAALNFIDDDLVSADFADPRLGRIFDGFYEMLAAKEPISVITVTDHLAGWDVRGIGAEHLHRWVEAVSSAASVGWYARKVHELATRRAIAASGLRLQQQIGRGADSAGELLAHAIDELREVQARGVREEVKARSLAMVLQQDVSYDWAIPGLLERGDRLILTGSEGGGKTTMLRQIAILAAAGLHPFAGPANEHSEFDPVRVLYVDTENTEKQWAREVSALATNAANLGRADPRQRLQLHISKRMNLMTDRDLGKLHKLLDATNADVLFIGPLYRLVKGNLNDEDDASALISALDTIHDRGVTLVMEAHAGKGSNRAGERDLAPRGSSALMGWPEFGLGLRVDKGAQSSKVFELVQWRGHRDAQRAWPRRVQRGAGTWPWMSA